MVSRNFAAAYRHDIFRRLCGYVMKFTAALRLEGKNFGSAAYNGGLGV